MRRDGRSVERAFVVVSRVRASRLLARLVALRAKANQATGCVLVRYGRYRFHVTEANRVSFRAIADDAAERQEVAVVLHLVVVATGGHSSTLHKGLHGCGDSGALADTALPYHRSKGCWSPVRPTESTLGERADRWQTEHTDEP